MLGHLIFKTAPALFVFIICNSCYVTSNVQTYEFEQLVISMGQQHLSLDNEHDNGLDQHRPFTEFTTSCTAALIYYRVTHYLKSDY
jgi:hypothetical protein